MEISKKELKKGEEEIQQLKRVLKASLQEEIKRTLEQTSILEQPQELKEQMEAIKSILSDLNQDRATVQRIADIVSAHNERQKLQDEEQAKKE